MAAGKWKQDYEADEIKKIVEFFSLAQDDFKSVEGLENAGNPHKHYVFARSRRFFYCLFLWRIFGKWCPNPTRGYKVI